MDADNRVKSFLPKIGTPPYKAEMGDLHVSMMKEGGEILASAMLTNERYYAIVLPDCRKTPDSLAQAGQLLRRRA
jgi:hypothetical protein